MRQYTHIVEMGNFVVIQTRRKRYVLDLVNKGTLSYVERRLQLLRMNPPYPVYPLSKRLECLEHLTNTRCREFIDSTGEIVRWTPKTFYSVVCRKILSRWTTNKGLMGIEVEGSPTKFIISPTHFRYAKILYFGRRTLFFGVCDEKQKNTRKKL